MSRKAAGKARAILEGVGLELCTIDACFSNYPLNDEEIVQAGLVKWINGQGNKQPATWEVLISAMNYAEIAQQHIEGLKEKLAFSVKEPKVCMYTITCVKVDADNLGHAWYIIYMWVCAVSSLLPTGLTHWPTLSLHILFSVLSRGGP